MDVAVGECYGAPICGARENIRKMMIWDHFSAIFPSSFTSRSKIWAEPSADSMLFNFYFPNSPRSILHPARSIVPRNDPHRVMIERHFFWCCFRSLFASSGTSKLLMYIYIHSMPHQKPLMAFHLGKRREVLEESLGLEKRARKKGQERLGLASSTQPTRARMEHLICSFLGELGGTRSQTRSMGERKR